MESCHQRFQSVFYFIGKKTPKTIKISSLISSLTSLKYYATFKVKNFESFFYNINTCLHNYQHWIAGRANILSIYITYIFFNFGVAFAVYFLCYFQKLQLLVVKKFWTKFCCIVLPYLWAQKMFLRLLNPYFKLDILNICALCGVFFSRYVRIKSSFCDEKNISGEIWDTL